MAEGARIDDAGARELITIMRAAMRRAREVVLNPPGGTERSREMARLQASARLRDLERELRRMNVQANGIINDRVRRTYAAGVRDAERMMREVGLVRADEPIQGALMGTEIQRAGVLVRRGQADINKAFNSIANVTGKAVRQANAVGLDKPKLRRLLAGGAIDGQPTRTVQQVRQMMRQIAIGGLVEVPTRNGTVITYKPDYYADLVYQTSMAEARVNGEIDRLAAKGHDLVRIIGSNSTNFCTAFVGKVYSLSGRHPVYPAYSSLPRGGPPFHPRCTKRIAPFNERLATPAQRAAALPDPNTSSLHNQPPTEAQKRFEAIKPPTPAPRPTPTPTPSPAPAPTPPTTPPPTVPARDRLIIDSPIPVPAVNQGIRAIEAVHELPPEILPVQVRWRVLPENTNGSYEAVGSRPIQILVSSRGRNPPLTVAHESGHWIDHQVFAPRGDVFGSTRSPELAEWRAAVESTEAFKFLSSLKMPTPKGKEAVRYLLRWHETFARAYAQWIAMRSGDAAMIEMATRAELVMIGQQWSPADFAPVAKALDALFRKRGLLRG